MSDPFVPSSLKSYVFRGVTKGMVLDQPPQAIDDNAYLDIQNFIACKEGLKRSAAFTAYAGGDEIPYRFVDMVTIWDSDGNQTTILITTQTLWKVNVSGVEEIEWAYSTGTVTVSGTSVTGSGTLWTSAGANVKPGDLLRIGANEAVIATIVSDTALTLVSADIPDQAGVTYKIQRTFSPGIMPFPDFVVFMGRLLITDGKHPLLEYYPITGAISEWIDNASKKINGGQDFVCECVGVYDDRVWVGHTVDPTDDDRRQRIRWSNLADPRNFSTPTSYLDLPYCYGSLKRIVPLGNSLVAYFDDAIFIGLPTNFPLAPVRFNYIETANAGLIGARAIVSFLNVHFLVTSVDICSLTSDGVIRRIGTPIINETINKCKEIQYVYAAVDVFNNTICIGFPISSPFIEKIWRYDYRIEAWSYETISTEMIANPLVDFEIEWDENNITWEETKDIYPTWDSAQISERRRFLYIETASKLWRQTEYDSLAFDTTPITASITTKDFDFSEGDYNKSVVRLSIRVQDIANRKDPIQFSVLISIDGGMSWKFVGELTIPAGVLEGHVNFRAKGSTFRAALSTSSDVPSYYIVERGIRVRAVGEELGVIIR